MASGINTASYRETDWDKKLNFLLDDLESTPKGNTISTGHESVLNNLNSALNASSNYIESRTYSEGPTTTKEVHKYSSYSTSNGKPFDLEERVQHMMPQSTGEGFGSKSMSKSSESHNGVNQKLVSSSIVSSVQEQNSSVSSSSMKTTKYSSQTEHQNIISGGRSRLKQNIDDLDTLLYDLNNAKKSSDVNDYTTSNFSSDDYGTTENASKPYSGLSSPASVRKVSEKYSSTDNQNHQRQFTSQITSSHQYSSPHQPTQNIPPQPYQSLSQGSNLQQHTNVPQPHYGTSSQHQYQHFTNSTQQYLSSGPISLPHSGRATPVNLAGTSTPTQQPPKKVEELFSQLSEFDPSIEPVGFIEPGPPNKMAHASYKYDDNVDYDETPVHIHRPETIPKAGPAVYYPPGEMFTGSEAEATLPLTEVDGKKKSKKKSSDDESGGKKGAAVVPICLPLCCAAPCVIM